MCKKVKEHKAVLQNHWDYRVMASMVSEEVSFEIHKIYYDEDGHEKMYNATPASLKHRSPVAVASFLQMVKSASKKPIIWKGIRFPDIYPL